MADRNAARLPLVWRAGDPQPDNRVTEVRTEFDRWQRITPRGWNPDYCWFNGDKYRWWDGLTYNRGPVYNVARLRRLHTMYGRKRRG